MIETIDLNDLFSLQTLPFDPDEEDFDVLIVGAGVVGCALFKEFAEQGAKTLLIEKANDILEGASKGNSALLHTGFDAPPESLELACIKKGYEEFLRIKDRFNLAFLNTQALVVAWNEEQLGKLEGILDKGRGNGIKELDLLEPDQIRRREPRLSSRAQGAVLVHGESVVDAWSAPLAYLRVGLAAGGSAVFSSPVTGGEYDGQFWNLRTPRGTFRSRLVVNAAGLYGDLVDRIAGFDDWKIIPRKGQFLIYDKSAYDLIRSIILPVPTKITKGVVLTRTAYGNLLLGPTAEDQESRTDRRTLRQTLQTLQEKGEAILPGLNEHKVVATFAGLRPASDRPEYRVHRNERGDWITAGGIRSTGLTSALGLAKHIFELSGLPSRPVDYRDPAVPNISVFAPRDYERPGYGRMVCHCEQVTEREIREALGGESPAGTYGGLRRRTRAVMGRCQGFNCLADVAAICREIKAKKEGAS
ncbi:FAD-dependent oxidoreductase [Nitratifractor sp.]